ncbi:Pre-mRNA-splicing factor 38 [Corchorus capsularis]|uniref:Pre-mRNA-splicing factor 38 n=1 Tax=Corchorus capsularis TaxID=210143 RepID=A0A1R3GB92_COCAP|nr:Pre-mRNA-splicing factor 38 [Corchorus capsularis]
MANRTDPAAKSIRGTNPQNLVEKILRSKIYQSKYWKEQCFGLTAETLVDKAMELKHIGGTYGGNRKPTPFMCLVMKMLQIQPEKDIVVEFIKNDDYKYVRVLGAFYLRLTGIDTDIYRYLEPLYNDYRKVRRRSPDGKYSLTHVDEVIDELLTTDYSCDIALPRIKKRWTLESLGALDARKSVLEDDFEEEEEKDENEQDGLEEEPAHEKDYYQARSPARERDRDRRHDNHRHRRDRDRGRRRSRSRSRSRSRDRKRHARSSLSPQRHEPEDGSAREETNKKKEKKEKKDDGTDHPDPEIAEANRIRASLGLKPLKL